MAKRKWGRSGLDPFSIIDEETGISICRLNETNWTEETREEFRRLIIAAPRLLAAAERARGALRDALRTGTGRGFIKPAAAERIFGDLDDAIQAARGPAPLAPDDPPAPYQFRCRSCGRVTDESCMCSRCMEA